jgi:hypothetical protein
MEILNKDNAKRLFDIILDIINLAGADGDATIVSKCQYKELADLFGEYAKFESRRTNDNDSIVFSNGIDSFVFTDDIKKLSFRDIIIQLIMPL